MGSFNLTWTHAASSSAQIVSWRQKGTSAWNTSPTYITPANPQTNTATTAVVGVLPNNFVYQFQIENVCADGTSQVSTISDDIVFQCVTPTFSSTSTTLTVNFGPVGNIDQMYLILKRTSGSTTAATVLVTTTPFSYTFTGLTPSTSYFVSYIMYATTNGVQVTSADYPTQLGANCTTSNFSTTS